MNNIDTKYEIISINEKLSLHFVYVPEGFEISKIDLSEHETKKLSRLKNLNRVKLLSHWKKQNGCLVKCFEKILKSKNWDFDKFPNPTVFAAQLKK